MWGMRWCVRPCGRGIRLRPSGYPQEIGNEEFLSLMSSHQLPCVRAMAVRKSAKGWWLRPAVEKKAS
eukprot:scaffold56936_cov49-Phaeocystis_antarctica.AAC.2